MVKYIIFILLINYTNALSECLKCQLNGECNSSYLNYPGKFCNEWKPSYNLTLPCCCPLAAECVNTLYSCKCEYVPSPDENLFNSMYLLIFPLIIIIIIITLLLDKKYNCWKDTTNNYKYDTYSTYNSYDNNFSTDTYSGDS